ncbi:hypothetical protein AAFF_G00427000 [Aldrovandia affinis]|uniref:Uncharacterized protein n=1 Tax=Aldrovandia affinis TaxID=143900 RepID=A0AAD7WJ05_9TELE|nr:hypothetical protein AAFF_G00427000 [Aldrovandia affinis]
MVNPGSAPRCGGPAESESQSGNPHLQRKHKPAANGKLRRTGENPKAASFRARLAFLRQSVCLIPSPS